MEGELQGAHSTQPVKKGGENWEEQRGTSNRGGRQGEGTRVRGPIETFEGRVQQE